MAQKKLSLKRPRHSRRVSAKLPRRATKSRDVPATQGMLDAFRNETMSRLSAQDYRFSSIEKLLIAYDRRFDRIDARLDKMDARFEAIEARLDRMDARFEAIEARLDRMEARLDKMDARFDKMDAHFDAVLARIDKTQSDLHRSLLLMEEQRAQNVFVLDGYTSLRDRQDRIEKRLAHLEDDHSS